MKTLLSVIAVSMIAMSSASALSFGAVDSDRNETNDIFAAQAGDGFVNMHEAQRAGINPADFKAADLNGDRKLTPTEFKTLG